MDPILIAVSQHALLLEVVEVDAQRLALLGVDHHAHHLFVGFGVERLGRLVVHALGDGPENLDVLLRLADGIGYLVRHIQEGSVRAGLNPVILEVMGARQHDVAVLAGFGELHVVGHDAGNLGKHLFDGLLLGRIAADGVRPDVVEKPHREILALQLARFQNLGQMKPRQFVVEAVESRREGEAGHIDRRLALPQMPDRGTALADVARKGGEAGPRHAHLLAVVVQMIARINGGRRVLGIHAGEFHNSVCGNLGDPLGPFRRAGGHVLLEQRPGRRDLYSVDFEAALHGGIGYLVDEAPSILIGIPHHIVSRLFQRGHLAGLNALKQKRAEERVLGKLRRTCLAEVRRPKEVAVVLAHEKGCARLLAHEVQVVPLVIDDGVEHGHAEGRVGTGLDGHPFGGLLGRDGVGGVDDDQVGTRILGLHAEVPAMGLRVGRIRVPD